MANVLFRELNVPYGDDELSLSVSIDIEDKEINEVCEKVIRMKEWLDDGEYYDDFDDDEEELIVEYEGYKYDAFIWEDLGWHEKIKEVLDVIVGKDKWKDTTEDFTFFVN